MVALIGRVYRRGHVMAWSARDAAVSAPQRQPGILAFPDVRPRMRPACAPGEEEPDTQAKVLALLTSIESDLKEVRALIAAGKAARDSTRCSEPARLAFPRRAPA